MSVVTVAYVTSHGTVITAVQQPGNSPGAVGGFDVQKNGTNSVCAIDGAIYRATTLGGAYSSYLALTGGVQAVCLIYPYFKWAGGDNTAATHPDVIAAFNGADASSRRLIWAEGGATVGTIHDITPDSGIVFGNANCVTSHFENHIAVFGTISGVLKLLTTNNQGGTWVNRGTITSPGFIRCRRHDNIGSASGSNLGQLYLASNSKIQISTKWAASSGPTAGMWPRNVVFVPTGLETVV